MTLAKMKFAIDDGSTNVKISWIDKGVVQSITSPNSF
ncbi:plasmid segregation protein ParM domain-containing protein, partial [Moritella sp.]